MKMTDLRKQSAKELGEQLGELKREQFNLRMQKAGGQLTKTHEIRRARRDVARIKTALGEKK
ncbi:50S ribosomal protein L29 [Pseudofulvimonas gallinarii]|jgi:large subunit ribosomal protein L29|uniref:Large ribosomal subunit protein uL29 n=1 Tax=Pseudofulvimonas gallinarii TaxID=634155 RepID=A0A4S3KWJ6_9GAMM|nr:50S ribosomal protein L29 [Pseudofulvimonas gallinarii]TCS98533.1 LSU ribosomal protein L29P [Pseudofulvimonas gallinarii]THD13672.1 50S ribosomal protein L29 [Pseudofulvimonas gallinarii]